MSCRMTTYRYTTELVLILSTPQTLSNWQDSVEIQPDTMTRLGGWLFRHRTALPLPVAVAILAIPPCDATSSTPLLVWGVAVTLLGELIRLWGVHHIGVISRTRSDRLGPLVASGPFAIVRNPLYVGNIMLWIGFALTARLLWLAPLILALLGAEYHAIVRWEERLLESRLGDAYRAYAAHVPRWIPNLRHGGPTLHHGGRGGHRGENLQGPTSASPVFSMVESFSLSETLFSERGTLLAIAAGYLLLWLKAQV
jgi:protein-S-isoprenylcysteine O-methyltransferase Ste14